MYVFRGKCVYMHYFTPSIKKEIGNNIRKIRKQKKLKQVEVATDAGMNPNYFGKIERGLVNPSLEKVYRIITSLEVSSSDILPF